MKLVEKKEGFTREQESWARESLQTGRTRRQVVDGLVQGGVKKDTALRLTRRLRDQIKTGG